MRRLLPYKVGGPKQWYIKDNVATAPLKDLWALAIADATVLGRGNIAPHAEGSVLREDHELEGGGQDRLMVGCPG